ncbi:MAG: hypothetical protein H6817_03810 [Phycisphaerales bacterium]|nr:hypothetical protein [Phycisphaerales bacterium]
MLSENDDALASLRHPVMGISLLAVLMVVGMPVLFALADRLYLVSQVSDDAYYYFNVAVNLAAGNGPTADGVTTTTGWHPLYGFALAAVHRGLSPSLDGFVKLAIGLNAIYFAMTGVFLGLAARRLWGRVAGWSAALLWWANPHAAMLVSVGLEGSIYGAVLSLLLWQVTVYVQPAEREAHASATMVRAGIVGICSGLVLLGRTDSIVLLPLVALVMLVLPRGTLASRAGAIVLMAAIALACLGGWWYFAWKHTGSTQQGSGAIKLLWRKSMNAEHGALWAVGYTAAVFGNYLLECAIKAPAFKWVLSALPGVSRHGTTEPTRAKRWLLHLLWVFPIGLGLAYALFLDRPRTWYYVPALVGFTLLTAGGVHVLITTAPVSGLQKLARRCLPLMAWLVVIESAAIFGRNLVSPRSTDQVFGALAAGWVEDHIDKFIEPGARIGCWHSGIVQYYTPGHTVINLDGLANNEILPVLRGEETMNAYWDERNIQAILGEPREKMGGYAEAWDGKQLVAVERFSAKHKSAEVRVVMSDAEAAKWQAHDATESSTDQ